MDIEEEKLYVAKAMKFYGGSFVNKLGEALDHADRNNAALIKDTWPEFWGRYKIMGLEMVGLPRDK